MDNVELWLTCINVRTKSNGWWAICCKTVARRTENVGSDVVGPGRNPLFTDEPAAIPESNGGWIGVMIRSVCCPGVGDNTDFSVWLLSEEP